MTSGGLDLLVVSDVWPPHFIGGYELGAHDVVSRLAARGHRVTVLTSTYDVPGPSVEGNVHRVLWEAMHWRPLDARSLLRESWRSARNRPVGRRVLRDACFDLVYLFNPSCLNAGVLQDVAAAGRPVVAYVSDNWVAEWPWCDRVYARWMEPRPWASAPRRLALALAKRLLRRLEVLARAPEHNPIRHAQFVSRHIQGISAPRMPLASHEVIPWGIEVERFRYRERPLAALRHWLYVGQLEEHKGVHVAVDAVARLRAAGEHVTLTLFGHDTTPYAKRLRARVERDGLGDAVRFAGARAREALWQEAYDRHGLLVFPTLWEEPFSITLLEAFASGLPVLATMTGGTGEILRHGETGTVFGAGSAEHLAVQYGNLGRDPARAVQMARRARELVERHLHVDRMVDRVERHLVEVAEGRGSAVAEPVEPALHSWEPAGVPVPASTRAVEPDEADGRWLAALWADGLPEAEPEPAPDAEALLAGASGAHGTLVRALWHLVRHHPRHRYLASDPRVQRWFQDFARSGGLLVPSRPDQVAG